MSIATRHRLAMAVAASSCALALAGCGGSTKATATPASHATTSAAADAATSAAAATTSAAPSVPPGPAFTERGLTGGLLAGADVGKDYRAVNANGKAQTRYEFGCIGGDETPPLRKIDSKDFSHSVSFAVMSPLGAKDFHSKTILEQYILFPSAQAAADEQKSLEATVTPDCLASHRFPSLNNMPPFTIAGTQTPYNQGGFTGVRINEDSTTEEQSPAHMQDQLVEARDGSVLVLIWMDDTNPSPDAGFQADAMTTTGKALDKLAATGH